MLGQRAEGHGTGKGFKTWAEKLEPVQQGLPLCWLSDVLAGIQLSLLSGQSDPLPCTEHLQFGWVSGMILGWEGEGNFFLPVQRGSGTVLQLLSPS